MGPAWRETLDNSRKPLKLSRIVRLLVKGFPNRFNNMKRLLFALAVSLATLVVSLPAAPPYYPIDQVKPGMIATGYTVWEGTKVETFKANILGVLRNVIGPKRDLILARLEGGPLAQTGVIAGRSGRT